MHFRYLLTICMAAILFSGWVPSTSATEVRPVSRGATLLPSRVCAQKSCEFRDQTGANVYRLSDGLLRRVSEGKELYQRQLNAKLEGVLLAAFSGSSNLLAVAIGRERVNQRGRSALSGSPHAPPSGGSGFVPSQHIPRGASDVVHPSDVDREHQVQLINPKSGNEVKTLVLGAFRPEDLALSNNGELVLLVGRDLQLKTRELRILNARSGKLEHQQALAPEAAVELASDGFRIGSGSWQVRLGTTAGVRQFLSADSFSIAEFSVECSSLLSGPRFEGKSIAVRQVKGASPELDQMLGSSLAVTLRKAGLSVLERQNLEQVLDEQWLQTTGLTSEEHAAALGKIGNPSFLAFGTLQLTGKTLSLNVRLVAVETSVVTSSCQLTCRDCSEEEYVEGVGFLVKAWTEE